LRERLIACLGAVLGIALTGGLTGYLFGHGPDVPLIVAPIGASAVLLFAVPSSPLAQPWPIIGGNTISALVGIFVAHVIHDPVVATGVGVSLAIGAMSLTRSLHPPGGAAALTGVLGGPAVAGWGLLFPLVPVALNSAIIVAVGILFHKLTRRNYPHVAQQPAENAHRTIDQPPSARAGFRDEDLDAALAVLHETFDIGRADLGALLRQVELQATVRTHGHISCRDVMSRDVITIGADASPALAKALLVKHDIRTLPVVDRRDRLVGTIGLRDIADITDTITQAISEPVVAAPDDAALSLLPALTDGRTHAVIVVDSDRHILGLISQTDLLSVTALLLPNARTPEPSTV
jgi:CBS domain-containing membrane protein